MSFLDKILNKKVTIVFNDGSSVTGIALAIDKDLNQLELQTHSGSQFITIGSWSKLKVSDRGDSQ